MASVEFYLLRGDECDLLGVTLLECPTECMSGACYTALVSTQEDKTRLFESYITIAETGSVRTATGFLMLCCQEAMPRCCCP